MLFEQQQEFFFKGHFAVMFLLVSNPDPAVPTALPQSQNHKTQG
jgi:hypothetical protein